MDERTLRERRRRKRQQLRRRRQIKLLTYFVAIILLIVFVIRGIIFPLVNRLGGDNVGESTEVSAQETTSGNTEAAIRQPIRGQQDLGKIDTLTPGWHTDENGRWYQNTDGTYYSDGFQEINNVTYYFDKNGYMQTGWISTAVNDYYFNEDGSYNPGKRRPMLALTFDDGPGQYTDTLLDCLEENGAHATFFMVGQNVGSYTSEVQRMVDIGCELGNHSWDHADMTSLSLDGVANEFASTDDALIQACGQPATVARCPYGSGSSDIWYAAGKPFFMWSLDTLDWKNRNVQMNYDAVMNGDLTDGTIILMHDIHPESVDAACQLIPDLIAKGYRLVTVSEMARAKGVTLQIASYSDFWDSSLATGKVAGYNGGSEDIVSSDDSTDSSSNDDYSDEDDSDDDYSYEDDSDDYDDDFDGDDE